MVLAGTFLGDLKCLSCRKCCPYNIIILQMFLAVEKTLFDNSTRDRANGFGWEQEGGGRKSVHADGGDRVNGFVVLSQQCRYVGVLLCRKNVW